MSNLDPVYEEHARLIAGRVAELLREQQSTTIPEYITTEEAARLISVPVRTLQNWRAREDGPPFTRFGQTIRYPVGDLRAWIERRRVTSE